MKLPKDPHKFIFSLGFAIVAAIEFYKYIMFLMR